MSELEKEVSGEILVKKMGSRLVIHEEEIEENINGVRREFFVCKSACTRLRIENNFPSFERSPGDVGLTEIQLLPFH